MQNVTKKLIDIIKENFPNGVRDDYIDTNRILRIYSAKGADENISLDRITDTIHANGIEYGGRFYFISENDAEYLLLSLSEILEQYNIAYYAALHKKHAEFFARFHIFSPEVLKKILQTNDTRYFYAEDFCAVNRTTRLDYEVARIFTAADKSLSLDDLQDALPYVPSEKIAALLSNTQKYFPTTDGKYIPAAKIQFDFDEIIAAKRQIALCLDAKGYADPDDYNLSANLALNPEVAEKDMLRFICEKYFVGNFTRRGNRFLNKSTSTREAFRDELLEFLVTRDEITLKRLKDFAKNRCTMSTALQFALKFLVRVSENLFVKDQLIKFDVAGIDEALTPFVQGKIIPLRGVTSFTGFPPIEGYSWNLFMLESFLRKYSNKYSFDTTEANNFNVGAIYPKAMNFKTYLDVQVAAIVQENIPLTQAAVEDFLLKQGYRRRSRSDKITAKIIAKAQEFVN